MSQPINKNIISGNTISRKKKERKPRVYWTTDTQLAVKEFLNFDHSHLQAKLDKYIDTNGLTDPSSIEYLDDGYIAQLKGDNLRTNKDYERRADPSVLIDTSALRSKPEMLKGLPAPRLSYS